MVREKGDFYFTYHIKVNLPWSMVLAKNVWLLGQRQSKNYYSTISGQIFSIYAYFLSSNPHKISKKSMWYVHMWQLVLQNKNSKSFLILTKFGWYLLLKETLCLFYCKINKPDICSRVRYYLFFKAAPTQVSLER